MSIHTSEVTLSWGTTGTRGAAFFRGTQAFASRGLSCRGRVSSTGVELRGFDVFRAQHATYVDISPLRADVFSLSAPVSSTIESSIALTAAKDFLLLNMAVGFREAGFEATNLLSSAMSKAGCSRISWVLDAFCGLMST